MTNKELVSLLKTLRQYGVLSYKSPKVELTLAQDIQPYPIQQEAPISHPSDPETPSKPSAEMTDEELLYWSSGGSAPESAPF